MYMYMYIYIFISDYLKFIITHPPNTFFLPMLLKISIKF